MSLLPICIYPDPVLRQKAQRVKNIDNGIQRLIDDMVETMYHAPGIGLAANQVGRPLSVLVIRYSARGIRIRADRAHKSRDW